MSDDSTSSTRPGDTGRGDCRALRVAVVGVCGSGKTTLVAGLRQCGYQAREVKQEHSYIHDLWRRFWTPHVLVFLEASDDVSRARLGHLGHAGVLARQRERLARARDECHVYVDTDPLSPEEVLRTTLSHLRRLDGPRAHASPGRGAGHSHPGKLEDRAGRSRSPRSAAGLPQ